MNKFALHLYALLATLLFSAAVSAIPLRFEEGKHYDIISQNASDKAVLTEYFSFYCPHCYRFEAAVAQIKPALPNGIEFEKSHVDFMRAASPKTQNALARALAAAKIMGNGDVVIPKIFANIHQNKVYFDSPDHVTDYISQELVKSGKKEADAKKFKSLMKSLQVVAAANKMKKSQTELSNRQVLTSVPMMIFRDKYKINMREVRSPADYRDLLQYLNTLEK